MHKPAITLAHLYDRFVRKEKENKTVKHQKVLHTLTLTSENTPCGRSEDRRETFPTRTGTSAEKNQMIWFPRFIFVHCCVQ